jgi:hypothetical protein
MSDHCRTRRIWSVSAGFSSSPIHLWPSNATSSFLLVRFMVWSSLPREVWSAPMEFSPPIRFPHSQTHLSWHLLAVHSKVVTKPALHCSPASTPTNPSFYVQLSEAIDYWANRLWFGIVKKSYIRCCAWDCRTLSSQRLKISEKPFLETFTHQCHGRIVSLPVFIVNFFFNSSQRSQ